MKLPAFRINYSMFQQNPSGRRDFKLRATPMEKKYIQSYPQYYPHYAQRWVDKPNKPFIRNMKMWIIFLTIRAMCITYPTYPHTFLKLSTTKECLQGVENSSYEQLSTVSTALLLLLSISLYLIVIIICSRKIKLSSSRKICHNRILDFQRRRHYEN